MIWYSTSSLYHSSSIQCIYSGSGRFDKNNHYVFIIKLDNSLETARLTDSRGFFRKLSKYCVTGSQRKHCILDSANRWGNSFCIWLKLAFQVKFHQMYDKKYSHLRVGADTFFEDVGFGKTTWTYHVSMYFAPWNRYQPYLVRYCTISLSFPHKGGSSARLRPPPHQGDQGQDWPGGQHTTVAGDQAPPGTCSLCPGCLPGCLCCCLRPLRPQSLPTSTNDAFCSHRLQRLPSKILNSEQWPILISETGLGLLLGLGYLLLCQGDHQSHRPVLQDPVPRVTEAWSTPSSRGPSSPPSPASPTAATWSTWKSWPCSGPPSSPAILLMWAPPSLLLLLLPAHPDLHDLLYPLLLRLSRRLPLCRDHLRPGLWVPLHQGGEVTGRKSCYIRFIPWSRWSVCWRPPWGSLPGCRQG